MNASDFTDESAKRSSDGVAAREERRAHFMATARANWGSLARLIEGTAIWNRNISEVEKGLVCSALGLSGHWKDRWSDMEAVVMELGAEHGFKVRSRWETIPKGWVFEWPQKEPKPRVVIEDAIMEYFQLHGYPEEHSPPLVAAKVISEFIADRMKVG